jgi:hypothetical protein
MFFRKKTKPKKPDKLAARKTIPSRVDTLGHRDPERRRKVQRDATERRTDVRWEPGGADRRQSHGRRKTDSAWRHH